MGQITIRMRSQQLGGLPNVRQVDTRGLGASNAEGLAAIGKGVQNLTSGLLQAGNTIDALIERDHERQANEAALAFRKEMDARLNGGDLNDKKYVGLFNAMQVGTVEERGVAAKGFSDNFKKAREESEGAVEASTMNKDVRRRFDEKVANYTQSKLNEGNNLANAVWSANTRGAAAAYLAEVTKDAAQNPSDAALIAVDKAIDERAFAEGWTAKQTRVEREKTAETIGAAIIDNKLALCQTDEDYARLESVLSNKPGAVKEEEVAKLLPGAAKKFVDNLTPEQRRKASEMVASKRYRAATIRNETFSNKVAEVTNLVLDGKINSDSVDKEIGALRTAGAPEKMLTPLLRTRDTLFDSECEQKARDVWMAIEQTEAQDNWAKAVNARVSALPEKVKSNPEFIKRIDAYKKYGREVVDATETARISEQKDMILYGEDAYVTSISDREQALRELSAMNPRYYPPEKMRADLKKLESMKKENRADLINRVSNFMKDVVGDTSIAANGVFLSDLTGRYGGEAKEGEAFLRKTFGDGGFLGSGAEEKDVREAWKQFSEGTSRWLDACDENPTWTDLQRAELYYDTVIQPIFGRLANAKLHQDEVTWRLTIQKTNQWLDSLREVGMSKVGEDASYTRYSSDRTKASPSATQKANNPNRKNP